MKRLLLMLLALCLPLSLLACREEAPPATTESLPTAPSTVPTVPTTAPSVPTTLPPTVPTEPPADPLSILSFLKIAKEPVGTTMYIWGGGWNEEDTGAGVEAVTLGLSPTWAQFAAGQTADYDYKNHRYEIHNGLDCSGYVGWAVYNLLETENGRPGYVMSSTAMAQTYADMGLGTYIPADQVTQWKPGDIMSMPGHVWICLGMCEDGSVLLVHASPPGVIFCGTQLPDGSESQAVRLARDIMQTHYPQWYARFPNCARPHSYLTKSSAMRWTMLSDGEGLGSMTAQQVAEILFAQGTA